jgi:hypothetical protein
MIWIFYHAPSDFATVLHTDADLDVGGLAVPKGEYALYIDLDKGNWKLIVNKQLMDVRRGRPLWGIANRKGDTTNDPTTELGRTVLTMGKPASPVETLKIALTRTDPATTSANHGKLEIGWENVTASVPFTVK